VNQSKTKNFHALALPHFESDLFMFKISSALSQRFAGVILIFLGVIANQWILTQAFSPDGVIEQTSLKLTIWMFDLACVLAGSLLLVFGMTALERVYRHASWAVLVISAVLLGLWLVAVEQIYFEWGLFRVLGADFALYAAQANVLRSGDTTGIYDLQALQPRLQEIHDLYAHQAVQAIQVPYPPLFAWLFRPFIAPEPHIGFILWSILNALAGLYLAWRAATFFHDRERPVVVLLILSSYPVIFALIVGQPILIFACALAHCYLALRAGNDFRAGLYLSLLLFKPQYGFLLGPVLIWKRRWTAVAGVAVGAVAIITGSVLVAGVSTVLQYPRAVTGMVGFRTDFPTAMINWHALILWLYPHISDPSGMMIETVLNGLTILLVGIAWKGPWQPGDQRFPLLISVTLVATLLANHHSHQHGGALLAVPLAAAVAQADLSRFTRLVIVGMCLLPALSYTLMFFLDIPLASRFLTISLLVCYAALLAELWTLRTTIKDSSKASLLKVQTA
jgi:hypothetical protein